LLRRLLREVRVKDWLLESLLQLGYIGYCVLYWLWSVSGSFSAVWLEAFVSLPNVSYEIG